MADGVKIDTVRSDSSGALGRPLNRTPHRRFGVTLIEKHAHDTGGPLRSMEAAGSLTSARRRSP